MADWGARLPNFSRIQLTQSLSQMAVTRFHIPPSLRLVAMSILGMALLLAVVGLAMQPADGPSLNPLQWRPIATVSGANWAAILTGFLAFLISAWVWALKPSDTPAILFASSGVATLGFSFSAVAFDIALPLSDAAFMNFANINALSASCFGIIMPCLFLIYPTRLPGWKILIPAVVLIFGSWTLWSLFGPVIDFDAVQRITFFEMIAIVLVVIWQVLASRSDPRKYAIAIWLGATTVIGSGAFIATVAAPITFGHSALLTEKYAFTFFLIIYFGLAIGLLRFRLFELGAWAYQLAFYVSAAIAFIVMDLVLVTFLALEQGPALGVSLLLIALAYLPLRDLVWRAVVRKKQASEELMFQQVLDCALQPSSQARVDGWRSMLKTYFTPLKIEPFDDNGPSATILDEGLTLYVPSTDEAPALAMMYRTEGRELFSPRDAALVDQLHRMLKHARESRTAYDRGVAEERTRIARDIHDNIGAQLMRALHSNRSERKDTMIRETLADLRDVINNAQSELLPLDEVFANLRAETADRLEPHDINLRWVLECDPNDSLAPAVVHAVRSVIREAASNAIKHAASTEVTVALDVSESEIKLSVTDNGSGFEPDRVTLGHGLANMKARIESLGGVFDLDASDRGARLTANLPRGGQS